MSTAVTSDVDASAMETEESATATAGTAPNKEATWSFVQMNMSLLPIARPLPVATMCHRFQTGKKPRTPNQKLHRRVLQNASNISPRRHELNGGSGAAVRRVSNAGLFGAASPSSQLNEQLRITVPSLSNSVSTFSPSSTLSPMDVSASFRHRSQSEDARPQRHRVNNKRLCGDDSGNTNSGYASDSCDSVMPPLLLLRSVSLSSASDAKAYKGKRIMELLDEERRLHPDERSSTAQSPTKRSRLHASRSHREPHCSSVQSCSAHSTLTAFSPSPSASASATVPVLCAAFSSRYLPAPGAPSERYPVHGERPRRLVDAGAVGHEHDGRGDRSEAQQASPVRRAAAVCPIVAYHVVVRD